MDNHNYVSSLDRMILYNVYVSIYTTMLVSDTTTTNPSSCDHYTDQYLNVIIL